jgi:lipopolysaccharide transport system permease protein
MLQLAKKTIKNRDLLLQFTKRELQLQHKGSRLGSLWNIISPLMMLALYLFIFGVIFNGKFGVLKNESFIDFALALFLGLNIYNIISESIISSPLIIVNQPNFVKKVVFPLEIIPISKITASLYNTLIGMCICVVLTPLGHGGLHLKVLIIPILIAPVVFTALGISWALSALGVFIRDINHVTNFLSAAIMYGSAIVYPTSRIPLRLYGILKFNPILTSIDESRRVLLWDSNINYTDIVFSYIISLIILYIGYYLFKKISPYFAEVL